MALPLICPTGQYCDATTLARRITPEDCPAGTFSDLYGLTSEDECQALAWGFYSATTGLTNWNLGTSCDAGNYCEVNTAVTPNRIADTDMEDCPAGSYCGNGEIWYNACPPGTYGNDPADTTNLCTSCSVGYYCPKFGMTDPAVAQWDDNSGSPDLNKYKCPDGYLCLGGAIDPSNRDDVTIKFCPVGYKCT